MKNFVNEGCSITLTAPADVVAGEAVKVGSIVVVAHESALSGASFVGLTKGVFSLPVDTSTPTEGSKAYLKSDGNFSTTASGNTLVGVFLSAKGADSNADVYITGQIA